MGRLTTVKSRLGKLPSRLGAVPVVERDRSQQRDANQPWRKWYKTARWQKLRRKVLKRDGYICKATGVMLVGKYPAANSPVVDHKIPHRGDADLFWDEDNLQALAKQHHDSVKQSQERRGLA